MPVVQGDPRRGPFHSRAGQGPDRDVPDRDGAEGNAPASWRNEEVREALDLCLSCKACASDCPTHVDMATYKSEFLSQYYKGRSRPPAMYAMGLLPLAARAATWSPTAARLVNASLGSALVGRQLKRVSGVTTQRPAPRFDEAARSRASARGDFPGVRDREPSETSVVVWPDTFTTRSTPVRRTTLSRHSRPWASE